LSLRLSKLWYDCIGMIRAKYRGYSICQQREFGPLKLLKWVEGADFIVTKDGANAMPGATFQRVEDARKAIDIYTETFRTYAAKPQS